MERALSFITRICLSTSGTCSSFDAIFKRIPWLSKSCLKAANSLSAKIVCTGLWHSESSISSNLCPLPLKRLITWLIAFRIVFFFLSGMAFTVMNLTSLTTVTRKLNSMICIKSTDNTISRLSFGVLLKFTDTCSGLLRMVFPFVVPRSFPYIDMAFL